MTTQTLDATFDAHFWNLSHLIAEQLAAGQPFDALALAAAFLVHRDSAIYVALSETHGSMPPQACVQEAAQQESNLAIGQSLTGEQLYQLFKVAPLALLTWLDRRLSLEIGTDRTLPAWVTSTSVQEVTLDHQVREKLDVASRLGKLFVFPRLQAHLRAPVQRQTHDPGRHLDCWEVVPAQIDAASSIRRLQVSTPASTTEWSLRARREAGCLTIYLAEFTTLPSFESKWDVGPLRVWTALGLLNEDLIAAAARQHVINARHHKADIVVFPELTVPPGVLSAIKDELAEGAVQAPEAAPALVIAGSFHESVDGRMLNRAVVLDGAGSNTRLADGSPLAHDKLTRVQLAGPRILEGNERGKTLFLVPTPIGTFSVVTCLDLAQGAVMDQVPLELVPIRWLWVPSLSELVNAHAERARQLSLQRESTVACANQAQVILGPADQLDGPGGQSFVWSNSNRGSAKVIPEESVTDAANCYLVFKVPVFGGVR